MTTTDPTDLSPLTPGQRRMRRMDRWIGRVYLPILMPASLPAIVAVVWLGDRYRDVLGPIVNSLGPVAAVAMVAFIVRLVLRLVRPKG